MPLVATFTNTLRELLGTLAVLHLGRLIIRIGRFMNSSYEKAGIGIMKKKGRTDKEMDDLVQSVGQIAKSLKSLARQAEAQYVFEVEEIIQSKDRSPQRIQHLLDSMLGFCFEDRVLALYKKLCRYYFYIDPEVTAFYINSYREMWDEESLKPAKKKVSKKTNL